MNGGVCFYIKIFLLLQVIVALIDTGADGIGLHRNIKVGSDETVGIKTDLSFQPFKSTAHVDPKIFDPELYFRTVVFGNEMLSKG